MDSLERAKDYLRITGEYDDVLIQMLIDSAHEYLRNAGVKKDEESNTYQLAVMMLVTHWYENREQVTESAPYNVSLGLQSIILQLKAGELHES